MSREALLDAMKRAVADADDCKVHVFFDSPEFSERKYATNVYEIFSGGGQADHRADGVIKGYLERCCQEHSAMPRILVTNDRELGQQVRDLHADIMYVQQFGAFLEEMVVQKIGG